MKFTRLAVFYGFITWFIPFSAGFFLFGVRQINRPLFDTLLPILVVATGTLCAVL